jgi:Immunity protein 51
MSLEPLALEETSPGTFSLLLRDLDMVSAAFEAAGHSGNGYSWEAVARHIVESSLSELEDRIEFDSEADMFCATSADCDALAKLGGELAEGAQSRKRLAKLIASVPASLWDD